MTDDLSRLLDLPAAARLIAAGDELQVVTLSHTSADEVVIRRRHLGTSIDLGELLEQIGSHGLPASQIQVSEIAAPQLPAPVEPPTEPGSDYACPECGKVFTNWRQVGPHRARAHRYTRDAGGKPSKHAKASPSDAPELPARPVAQRQHVCPQCGKDCKTPAALGSHARTHRAPKKLPEPTPAPPAPEAATPKHSYPCGSCGREYRSQHGLDVHRQMAHWQELEAQAAAPEAPEPAPEDPAPPAPVVVQSEGICDVCRLPVDEHVRCADCRMLLGDGHYAGPVHLVVNRQPLCASCVAYRGTGVRAKP